MDDGLLLSDPSLDLINVDYLAILADFHEGVIITDPAGKVLFYNRTLAMIDDLTPEYAIGRPVTEIYDLTPERSMVMRCLRTREPLINRTFVYRTRLGKVINSIHSVFPLRRGEKLIGSICFVKDYNLLESTIEAASGHLPRPSTASKGNGTRFTFRDIIGSSADFRSSVEKAILSAGTSSPVMLHGETGTGKELFAQSIHNHGPRAEGRYIAINCAAIPENLLEGVLFGTTRGAFTGATDKPGLFEKANGGTLFLDDIDYMPAGLQTKLLRVLQESKVRRVGSLRETPIDLKVISSIHTEPRQAIAEGLIRTDLFYRLGVVFISIPPLRSRRADIPGLIAHFINKFNLSMGKKVSGVADRVEAMFESHPWPGNVRELEHMIEAAMNMVQDEELIENLHLPGHFVDLGLQPAESGREVEPGWEPKPVKVRSAGGLFAGGDQSRSSDRPSLAQMQADREKEMVRQALIRTRGNVSAAARNLGLSRQLLHYKMKKYGFKRDDFVV